MPTDAGGGLPFSNITGPLAQLASVVPADESDRCWAAAAFGHCFRSVCILGMCRVSQMPPSQPALQYAMG